MWPAAAETRLFDPSHEPPCCRRPRSVRRTSPSTASRVSHQRRTAFKFSRGASGFGSKSSQAREMRPAHNTSQAARSARCAHPAFQAWPPLTAILSLLRVRVLPPQEAPSGGSTARPSGSPSATSGSPPCRRRRGARRCAPRWRSPLALPAGASVGASAGASTVLSARSTYTPLAPVSLLSSLPSPTGDAGGVDGHCYHAAGRGA